MEVQKIFLRPNSGTEKAEKKKLRVAAYCRVSTDSCEQKTSFDGQVKHYMELIEKNPEWEMAGIYADEGITGTSAARRPEFQRLMADCEEGRIDLVLTKSISRFARNTLELLACVRHLIDINVHIVFESNQIDTRAAYSEMLLTILAAFAQEESRSISENTIWGVRKRFETGVTRWVRLYGYEKGANGEHVIVPEQAAVVRKIFQLYEKGTSTKDIIRYLHESGTASPNGGKKWTAASVNNLLNNERYAGDLLLQKFHVENHISHKCVPNDSTEVPSYYIENHHTPIVSKKQYKRCGEIMRMRRINGMGGEAGNCNQYPLGTKLRCPYCGSVLYQRNVPVQSTRAAGWCCEIGENACRGFIIRSHFVEEALLEAYKELNPADIEEKQTSSLYGEAAKLMLDIKREHPAFERVDYWWVDDFVDYIEFGPHKKNERECRRMAALGEKDQDDRIMKVYWKCGLVAAVKSGVTEDRSNPAAVAKLYNKYLERRKTKEARSEHHTDTPKKGSS
ncbi:MAG: recombinase family protein [Lachnospiraceae bacterium]|nr:recombinase family protein [Lachnospiraceae bacterium]